MRLRIVPITCLAAASLLVVKASDIWLESSVAFADTGPVRSAKPSPAKPAKPVEAPKPEAAVQPPVAPAGSFPPNGSAPAPAPGTTPATAQSNAAPPTQTAALPPVPPLQPESSKDSFSPAEVEVLQSLAERRAEIDKRSQSLDQREAMLKVTEQRVEEKVARLKTIESTIKDLLKQADAQEEAKLQSLVKIYETMKPKEAARIFEQLDMPVLLNVLDRMKELKSAPILASMDPEKAKLVTMALVERRKLPEVKP